MIENDTLAIQKLECTLPYEIPQENWLWYASYAWWMEGFGSIWIGSLGILLNFTSISVLLGSVLGASFFNWLLVFLAFFDSLFLLNGILEAFRNHISGEPSYHHDYAFVNFLYPFRSVVMGCSMYMTVILALERYNALTKPAAHFRNNKQHSIGGIGNNNFLGHFQTHWIRIVKYVGPIIIFSTLFYAPKYMELYLAKNIKCNATTDENSDCSEYVIALSDMRKSDGYVLWYLNVMNLIVTTIIPLISLMYLNFNVYLKYKHYIRRQPSTHQRQQCHLNPILSNVQERFRNRERDAVQQTMILFVIVILFCLSHVLRICLNVEELKSLTAEREALQNGCEWVKFWTIIVAPISHILLQVNSGINFFIYCLFNQAFRDILVTKLSNVFKTISCARKVQGELDTNDLSIDLEQPNGDITTNAHASGPNIELENLNLANNGIE